MMTSMTVSINAATTRAQKPTYSSSCCAGCIPGRWSRSFDIRFLLRSIKLNLRNAIGHAKTSIPDRGGGHALPRPGQQVQQAIEFDRLGQVRVEAGFAG